MKAMARKCATQTALELSYKKRPAFVAGFWCLEFVRSDDVEHETQDSGMETGHEDEANGTGDEASKLNFFVIVEAAS